MKFSVSYSAYHTPESYSDTVYKEYMTLLAGRLTDDKMNYISKERKTIDDTLARLGDEQLSYINGEISYDEFGEYLQLYNYAYSHNELFSVIEQHTSYIDKMEANGHSAEFVYDTGWNNMFFAPFDWSLYIIIILICSGIFASEYAGKSSDGCFSQILRTTKYGRRKTCRSKFAAAVVLSLFASVIWNAVDILLIIKSFDLPMMSAPLYSIEKFAGFEVNMTIFQYALFCFLIRLFAAVSLAIFTCSLSAVLINQLAAIAIIAVITLLPALLSYFGLTAFSLMDFTSMMRATPILLKNTAGNIYICIDMFLCALGITYSDRVWNK